MRNHRLMTGTLIAVLLLALCASFQSGAAAQATAFVVGDAYPLGTCVVSGKKLGSMGKPFLYSHEGREIRLCCKGCVKKFESAAAEYVKKIDAAIIKQQSRFYPLETCIVMGDPLKGEGVKPVDHVYKNRLVRFCCRKCIGKFNENPARYLKKLDAAVVKAQVKSYPLDTCVVAGGKLGGMGEPCNYVHANRLVRFCCAGCIKSFRKEPLKYLAMIDKKMKSKTGKATKGSDAQAGGKASGSVR